MSAAYTPVFTVHRYIRHVVNIDLLQQMFVKKIKLLKEIHKFTKRLTSSDFLVLSQLQKCERTGKEHGCLPICLKN